MSTTGTWYPPSLGTGSFLANPPMIYYHGQLVIMQSRLRADVVTVSAVDNGMVSVEGTTARFDATTGLQCTHPNCWPGWRIMPLKP